MENGRRTPSLESLNVIASVLGVRAGELLHGKTMETVTMALESYNGLISEIERLQDRVKELEGKK